MYQIEIEGLGDDLTHQCGTSYFVSADAIVSEGDTLEELIENATVYTCDQDGASGPQIQVADLNDRLFEHYADLIKDAYESQIETEE